MSATKNKRFSFPRLERRKLETLKGAPYNPRTIAPEALERLKASLQDLGNLSPITVNARTGNIVGGHQRVRLLQALGHRDTDVWLVDLDETQEKAANLALNNLAGEWDQAALRKVIDELQASEVDLRVTGFTEETLQGLIEDLYEEKGGDESSTLGERFEVIIECGNETEQRTLFERLQKEGKKCRVLTL